MTDYIITGKAKKKVLITQSYLDAYEFIMKNPDAKVRTIDYNAKLSLVPKKQFLKLFRENTQDLNKFCDLAGSWIKGKTNIYDFLKAESMLDYFRNYRLITENSP